MIVLRVLWSVWLLSAAAIVTTVDAQFVCDGLTFELFDSRYPSVQLKDVGAAHPITEQAILDKIRSDIVQYSFNRLQSLNTSQLNVSYFNSGAIRILPDIDDVDVVRDLVLSCNASDRFEFELDHYVFEQVCCSPAPTSSPTACPTVAPTISPTAVLPCQSVVLPTESCPDDPLFRTLGCGTRSINLVFLLDMSGSIDETEFNRMIVFARSLLELMELTRDSAVDQTPAAVVLFEGQGTLEFGFVQGRTPSLAMDRLDDVSFDQAAFDQNYPTNIVGALQFVNVVASNTGNTNPTYILLFTDGDDPEAGRGDAGALKSSIAALQSVGAEVIPISVGSPVDLDLTTLALTASTGLISNLDQGEQSISIVRQQAVDSVDFDASTMLSLRARQHLNVSWDRGLTITASLRQDVGNSGYVFSKTSANGTLFWAVFADANEGIHFTFRYVGDGASQEHTVAFGSSTVVADGQAHELEIKIAENEAVLCVDGCSNASTFTMPLVDSSSIDDCDVEGDDCQLHVGGTATGSDYFGGTIANLTLCDGVHVVQPFQTSAPVSAECSPAPTTSTPTAAPSTSPTSSPTNTAICQSVLKDESSCIDPQFSPIGRLVCEQEFNVVFVLDASGSIDDTEYQLALRYLQSVIVLLDETRTSSVKTPAALVRFDSSAQIVFNFVEGATRTAAFDAVGNSSARDLSVVGDNPGTDMAKSLRQVKNIIASTTDGHQTNLPTFVLLISDGVPSGGIAEVLVAADELKALDNIEVMTLPVGSTPAGRVLLKTLASSRFFAYTDLFGGFPALLQQVRTTFGQVISDRAFGHTIAFDGQSTALLLKQQEVTLPTFSVTGIVVQTTGNSGYIIAKSSAIGVLHWGIFSSSSRGIEFHYRVADEGSDVGSGALNRVPFGTVTIVADGTPHTLDFRLGSEEVALCVDGCDAGASDITHTLAGRVSDCGESTRECVLYVGRQASLDVSDASFFGGSLIDLEICAIFEQITATTTSSVGSVGISSTTSPLTTVAPFVQLLDASRIVAVTGQSRIFGAGGATPLVVFDGDTIYRHTMFQVLELASFQVEIQFAQTAASEGTLFTVVDDTLNTVVFEVASESSPSGLVVHVQQQLGAATTSFSFDQAVINDGSIHVLTLTSQGGELLVAVDGTNVTSIVFDVTYPPFVSSWFAGGNPFDTNFYRGIMTSLVLRLL
eukprot:m.101153 g.101153  ORF g.101153 m.101153 type:complete len:1187 (-) comp27309_c0_seq1:223-3783(-)